MRLTTLLFLSVPALAQSTHKLAVSANTVVVGSYDATVTPALRIVSGDFVEVETLAAVGLERWKALNVPESKYLAALRSVVAANPNTSGHFLTGPIFIEGAEPGDTLEVQILDVRPPVPYAYNGLGRTGALADLFPQPASKLIELDAPNRIGRFAPGIEIPLRPFFGSMGVAPPTGKISSVPPGAHAGNLDNKELIAGSKLFIPVQVKGALFYIGDGHAAQGDGEIDVTALETHMEGRLRFIVQKGINLRWPRAETPTHWIVMGLDEDLNKAMRLAAEEAVNFLVETKKMSRVDAYMLSSTAVDFRVTQVVDRTKGIHGMIPKSLFK